MNKEQFTVGQASEKLGVSVWKVRRLCRSGMVPWIKRSQAGYQLFTPEQVSYMSMLLILEKAGMPRKNLKRFSELFRRGERTLTERKAMLETQRRNFWQELEDLHQGIDVIERQIELIDQKLAK